MVVECSGGGSIASFEQGHLLVSFGLEKFWLLCWPSPAPATAQRPPEAEVNISDFERYILVQNGGSSGAGRLGVFAPRSAFGQSGGPGWLSRPPV